MANKEILRVEIDDSAFTEFKKKFDAYESAVKALPGEWQKSGTEITAQKSHFEAMADSIRAQAEEAANLVTSAGKIGAALEGGAIALVGMAKSGRQFAGHIFQATASLRHWTKLTAVFAGLVGAGGLFGINRMAESVARNRTSAAGLGVTYGERASFLANFGRIPGAEGLLQGFSEAETDVAKKYALRQYLGHGESGDPAKDFAEGLLRFKTLVDRTPRELLGPALRQRGYDKLGFDTETALSVKGMSRGEIEQIGRGYGADLATRLGLSPDISRKWTEFTTRIEKAGEDIDTVLWKGTVKLAQPLEHLSEGFEHLVAAMFRDGSPISGWIKKLGHGISAFADSLGSGAIHTAADTLFRDAGAVAQLFDAIITKAPRGLAVLLGMAAGARFGGAAVAAGAALARAGPVGAALAGAGAVGLGMNKMMPQHPERLKRGREYENAGGSPTSPHPAATAEHFRRARAIFGHPHIHHTAPILRGQEYERAGGSPTSPHPAATAATREIGDENIPLSGGAAGRRDSLSGMQPDFRARLAAMFHDAPAGSSVFSGYRSPALQAELYRHPHRPGYVARPGHSHHGFGDAADIHGNLAWFHKHAHEYGLRFPMSYENWHIQSDPNTRVPVPRHAPSARRRSFGHPHIGHHPSTISHAQQHTMIEDQTGGMVSVAGDHSRYGGHPNLPGAGERFRQAAEFYRLQPEHFRPMIGNDVEDRRFEGPRRGGLLPDVPDAPVGRHITDRLRGQGHPLGSYHQSGLPPIEQETDKYLQGLRERGREERQREWDEMIKRSDEQYRKKRHAPTS